MRIVDEALLTPGCCAATGTGKGPFLDVERDDDTGNRVYLSLSWLKEAGVLVGLGEPGVVDELREKLKTVQGELDDALEASEELTELRRSVRKTLLAGAVEVKDGQRELLKLRPVPGRKAVDIDG